MKKISYLLLLLAAFLVLPFGVFAEGEEGGEVATTGEEEKPQVVASVETDLKVNVYLFRGEGCPHCAQEEEWIKSIKKKYKDTVNFYDFEVWYDEDNREKLKQVGEVFDLEIKGVPFTVIGDKHYDKSIFMFSLYSNGRIDGDPGRNETGHRFRK